MGMADCADENRKTEEAKQEGVGSARLNFEERFENATFWKVVFWMVVICVGWCFLYWLNGKCSFGLEMDMNHLYDSFIVIQSVFIALTVWIAWKAFNSQLRQLKSQEDLLREQKQHLENQDLLLKKQNFDSTFYILIDLVRKFHDGVQIDLRNKKDKICRTYVGIQSFEFFGHKIQKIIECIDCVNENNTIYANDSLKATCKSGTVIRGNKFLWDKLDILIIRKEFSGWCAMCVNLLDYIDRADISLKIDHKYYVSIVQSMLTDNELYVLFVLIFTNRIDYDNNVCIKGRRLVKKYKFFPDKVREKLNKECMIPPGNDVYSLKKYFEFDDSAFD